MSSPHHVNLRKAMDKDLAKKDFGKTRKSDGLEEKDIQILEGGYIERKAHMGALHDLDRLASTILAIVFSGTESLFFGSQDAINQTTVACAIDSDMTLVIATNKVKWQRKVREEKYDHQHRDQAKYKQELARLEEAWKTTKKKELETQGKLVPPKIWIPQDELSELKEQAETASLHHHHMPHKVDPREKPQGAVLFDPEEELRGILRDISNGLVSNFKLLNKDEGAEFHAEMRLLSYFVGERKCRPHLNVIGVSKPCCRFCSFWLLSFGVQISTYHTITPFEWTKPSCSSADGIISLSTPWSERMASPGAMQDYSKRLLSPATTQEEEQIKKVCGDWPASFRPSQ